MAPLRRPHVHRPLRSRHHRHRTLALDQRSLDRIRASVGRPQRVGVESRTPRVWGRIQGSTTECNGEGGGWSLRSASTLVDGRTRWSTIDSRRMTGGGDEACEVGDGGLEHVAERLLPPRWVSLPNMCEQVHVSKRLTPSVFDCSRRHAGHHHLFSTT
jgi:hypothetical protein